MHKLFDLLFYFQIKAIEKFQIILYYEPVMANNLPSNKKK